MEPALEHPQWDPQCFTRFAYFQVLSGNPKTSKLLNYLVGKNWEAGVLPLNYSRPVGDKLMITPEFRTLSTVIYADAGTRNGSAMFGADTICWHNSRAQLVSVP